MVEEHLQTFIRNAGETTGVGILGLAVTALLLINTIQTAFDRIWGGGTRLQDPALPGLLGADHAGTDPVRHRLLDLQLCLRAARSRSDLDVSDAVRFLSCVAPFLLEAIGFTAVLSVDADAGRCAWMDAATGAIIAAVLFERLKRAFRHLSRLPRQLPDALWRAGDAADLPHLDVSRPGWPCWSARRSTASLPEWRSGRRDPDERPQAWRRAGTRARASWPCLRRCAEHAESAARSSTASQPRAGRRDRQADLGHGHALRGARFVVRSDNRPLGAGARPRRR